LKNIKNFYIIYIENERKEVFESYEQKAEVYRVDYNECEC